VNAGGGLGGLVLDFLILVVWDQRAPAEELVILAIGCGAKVTSFALISSVLVAHFLETLNFFHILGGWH
jgi:hypothetical protein